jgi:hypothetical protein
MNKAFGNKLNRADDCSTQDPKLRQWRLKNTNKQGMASTSSQAEKTQFFEKPKQNVLFSRSYYQNVQNKITDPLDNLQLVSKARLKSVKETKSPEKAITKISYAPGQVKRTVANTNLKAGDQLSQPKKPALCDNQTEVFNHLLNVQGSYDLPQIPDQNRGYFVIGVEGIIQISKALKVRRETELLACFLYHLVCSRMAKNQLSQFVLASILTASKIEEYYPPFIEDLIKTANLYTRLAVMTGFEMVMRDTIINNEATLLELRSFKVLVPPVFDFGYMLVQEVGLEYKVRGTMYESLVSEAMRLPNIFTYSCVTIAVGMIMMSYSPDPENYVKPEEARDAKIELLEQISKHLASEYEYVLDTTQVTQICNNLTPILCNSK